jgi:UDP:flavonoid glycosyltransferase YjiC (YdhE family)
MSKMSSIMRRARAGALAKIRKRGLRPPRAYWALRYGPSRMVATARFGAGGRRRAESPGGLPPPGSVSRNILFYAINGSGLGHLTRCLAIARHLQGVTPFFLTTCTRASVLDAYGIEYSYLPSWEDARAQGAAVDRGTWNEELERVLTEEIQKRRPAIVVFDGVAPDDGLVRAMRAAPHVGRAAIRRAYRLDGREYLVAARDAEDDLLIVPHEPGAERIPIPDGPEAHWVGNVMLSDQSEALSRDAARAELGIDGSKPAVLVQLGSGVLGGGRRFRQELLEGLAKLDAHVVATQYDPSGPATIGSIHRFPIAPVLPAFDAAVGAAGYNTYTELLHHGVASVLVPNDHMLSDDQVARAQRADRAGAAFMVREGDVATMVAAVKRLLDDDELRARMAARGRELVPRNGGPDAAKILDDYCARIIARSAS